jgi:diguanylate cyclase (GGDEF)-like protein/PAS domain S-box-containing protein
MQDKKNDQKQLPKIFLWAGIFFSICISSLFSYNSWNNYMLQAKSEAIGLAQSVASFIEPSQIITLNTNINSTTYQTIKRGLSDFKIHNPEIDYAYIFKLKGGKLYFAVDSELPQSEGYSPPGQEYYEATEQDKLPFLTGEPLLTPPLTDRWGTWVSALVPIKDSQTGAVIAILGIDYPSTYWKAKICHHVLPDVAIFFGILLLLFIIYYIYLGIIKTKVLSQKLYEREALFKAVFEQAPVGIALIYDRNYRSEINTEFTRILSRDKDEISLLKWTDITHPDDLKYDMEQFTRFKSGELPGYSMEKRYFKPDGSYIWVHMVVAKIQVNRTSSKAWDHLCIVQDINDRKIAEDALRESERSKSMLLANLPGMAYRCNYDKDWTMKFVSEGCYELTGYKPESLIDNNELSFNDLIAPDFRQFLWNKWEHILSLRMPFRCEYEITTGTGERKWVLETGQGVYNEDGSVEALEGIIIDITESKQQQIQIQYINDHDSLTGVYNRSYYERAKPLLEAESNLPLSIIIVDINGLRLINDIFGHTSGNLLISETAKIIHSCCRERDILARTGGDEFSIISPNTDFDKANEIRLSIKKACAEYNRSLTDKSLEINLSLGYGVRQTKETSIEETEKDAEAYMDRRKLLNKKSHHNTILTSIMATLYARSYETEEHAARLVRYTKMIGENMNFSQSRLDELQLFSLLHDIGKIGIDDRILNKSGELTSDEWEIMKKHPEIGYVITMSSPEFAPIAECVLSHHEHWNGTGYPLGLCGEEIPLLARILAIADAYDAMTEDRIYRKALTKEAAIEEIRKNTGSQFDPSIAEIFIKFV